MFDARIFPNSLDKAKKILIDKGAIFKGEYTIHDIIFSSKNLDEDLDKIFLRLRFIPQNIWNEKQIVVAIKSTELKEVGKQSQVLLKEQFDDESVAREFIKKNYMDKFQYLFEFDRKGWQYDLGEDQVDLEDIQGLYSIEFKSKTEESLKNLLERFNIKNDEVLKDSSFVVIKEKLKI